MLRAKAATSTLLGTTFLGIALLGVVAGGVGTGCGGEQVGLICDLGGEQPAPGEVIVSSPALDCVSRECLYVPLGRTLPAGSMYPSGANGLCTAECEQDSDCERVPASPCVTGFTCAIAVTVGPFCCQKFCQCNDYIVIPSDGVIPPPEACDAGSAANACCNLPGRAGNSAYPLCGG